MIDFIELLHQILESGLSWASATAIILAFIKIKDGRHKRKLNEQNHSKISIIQSDIAAIKEALGLSNHSPPPSSKRAAILSSGSYFLSLRKGIQWASQLRRKKMEKQVNYVTMTAGLLSAIKLVLQTFGIDVITDDHINAITNGVSALVTIISVIISHRKQVKEAANNVYAGDPAERVSMED